MKKRPIIFNGEMIRAILEGRKTQTRRVIKGELFNIDEIINDSEAVSKVPWVDGWGFHPDTGELVNVREYVSPYGQTGDRLWVRETWAMSGMNRIEYRAFPADGKDFRSVTSWRPSIHMPRWASRITLEIVNVRVERLQEISNNDASKEGIYIDNLARYQRDNHVSFWNLYIHAFSLLWNSIHKKKDRWEDNPLVWVIEFKKI